jgi:adenosylcobinamide kinase / adenosylcobinamide-phosphate guanylyltransferase
MIASRTTLILGGARSGKSSFAQRLAEDSGHEKVFIATARALDEEMGDRIRLHQDNRGADWRLREESIALAEAIRAEAAPTRVLLVDCLTIWLTNLMVEGADPEDRQRSLLDAIREARGPLLLVTNEVGQGVVPDTPLGRAFRDAQGRLNQSVASVCDAVILVAAGCPVLLKPAPPLGVTLA